MLNNLSPTVKFIIAAVFLALGLFFIILAAALDKTYWAFTVLIPILFMAIPLVLVPPNPDGEGSFFESMANFFVGIAISSVFGLIFVLKHCEVITGKDLAFTITAIVFLIISVVFVTLAVRRDTSYMSSY